MATYSVPIMSQKTLNLCWEACGHMMWEWKYRNNKTVRNQYSKKAGKYATMNAGLTGAQLDIYCKKLGMRSLTRSTGANVRHALGWSPVIITSASKVAGHAMIAIGHSKGQYSIINPCAVQVVDFSTASSGSCSAGTLKLSETKVDKELGKYIWYW